MRALKLFRTSGRLSVIVSDAVAPLGLDVLVVMAGKRTAGTSRSHGHTAPLPAVPRPDSSVAAARGSPSRHRPSDDARCATEDPPARLPDPPSTRGSTGAGSRTTRSCRARSTTSRRRRTATARPCRGSTWCSTSSRRADTTSAQSILGTLLDHPHDAAGRVLPLAPAAAVARPLDRGCARQPARARGRLQRRTRHRRRVQPAEADGPHRPADVRRRRLAVHAGGGLGAGDRLPPRRARRPELGRRDRASCSAARRRWRRTASGRRSRSRRRSSCRCCSTSKTTASASRCAATCRRRARTSRRISRRSRTCSCATATASIPPKRRS